MKRPAHRKRSLLRSRFSPRHIVRATSPAKCYRSSEATDSSRSHAKEYHPMKKLLALFALLPAFALAADKENPDHNFYTKAAAGGMQEVELAKLAEQHAKSAQVKAFAEMMVKEHTAAND